MVRGVLNGNAEIVSLGQMLAIADRFDARTAYNT